MGLVMTKIKLTNALDLRAATDGALPPQAVRSVEVEALADTGAIELCIPEEIAELLGVPITRTRRVTVADGRKLEVTLVGFLEIDVLGRGTLAEAIVLPRGTRPCSAPFSWNSSTSSSFREPAKSSATPNIPTAPSSPSSVRV